LFVDHVRPRWSLTEQQRGELRWWLPFNLQLLCGRCHADKTAREAAERAELRRARS
jgi:5-methylcytosine-specific restriction endonuclease McrA